MKKLALGLIYLIISLYCVVYFEAVEAVAIPTLLVFVWVILSGVINVLIERLVKTRFRLSKGKEYKDKKSPIYKLFKGSFDSYYSIEKYELQYQDLDDLYIFFLPFSTLFQKFGYRHTNTVHTKIGEKDLGTIENLAIIFEEIYKVEKAKYDLETISYIKAKSAKENLNKEFKENYIG